MSPYCKSCIGFPSIVMENLLFYQNKQGDLKREKKSLTGTGGAVGTHILLCGDKMKLIKIKKNAWTYRSFKLSVKSTFIQMTNVISKEISTHRRYKCAGGAENIHDQMTSNVLGILRNGKHLIIRNIFKSRDMKIRQRTKYNLLKLYFSWV